MPVPRLLLARPLSDNPSHETDERTATAIGLMTRAGHQAADHWHGPTGCESGGGQPIRSAKETMIPSGPRT